MNQYQLNYSLVATFAMAGAMILSPVSHAMAEETKITLGDDDSAIIQGGGTKVKTDASGNVKVYVNGNGSVSVYTNDNVAVLPAVNDAVTAAPAPEVGEKLGDGSIYAGNDFAVTAADAPDLYNWDNAKHHCEYLVAHGHDDWDLPTIDQLYYLYQIKNTGSFADTFNETGSYPGGYYWSSSKSIFLHARSQRFSDGYQDDIIKLGDLAVRCVRSIAP